MRATRRAALRGAATRTATALAGLTTSCGPGSWSPRRRGGARVVHVAAFGLDATGAAVDLKQAAHTVNEQRLEFEVRVHSLPLPSPPAPPAPPSSTPPPTPTPFVPTAAALEQALTGGSTPMGREVPALDLALVTAVWELPVLLERKLIEPADRLWNVDRLGRLEDFAPGALEAVRTGGHLAALPLGGWVQVLYYDPVLFEAAGVARPGRAWTWHALVEAGKRLTRTGGDQEQWGILAHEAPSLLLSLIWSHGGEVVSKDAKRSLLAEPAAREGIQFWADLLLRHHIAPIPPPGVRLEWGLGATAQWVIAREATSRAEVGPRHRLAMHQQISRYLTLPPAASSSPPPRTVTISDMPHARQRATGLGLSAVLAVLRTAQDPRLAARASVVLAEHLLPSPGSNWGFPVRKPESALLHQVEPRLSQAEAEVVSRAFGYSRALPPELSSPVVGVLRTKVMGPLVNRLASVDEAVRDASEALDELLRG